MSTSGHGSDNSALEGDGIDIKKIVLVGAASMAIFALSAVVAYIILRHDTAAFDERGRPPVPSKIGKDEIGIVDQPEFDGDRRLEEWKAVKQHRLNHYGWVDRKKNLIHIPIDQAIDQVVAESAAGSPQ
jgi:hypothetical protein